LLFTNKNCYLIITGKWNCAFIGTIQKSSDF
jgi:hypothetical protein